MIIYMKKKRIISWNVNGIRAWHKKGAMDDLLTLKPDIFCLQEIKAEKEQLSEEIQEPKGYYSYFNSSKTRRGYSGVAIYTKEEPNEVTEGLGIKALDQEGRLLSAFFDDYVVITGYFPNGGGGEERLKYKMKFYQAFLKYIQGLRDEGYQVIFCGDVNTAHQAIDLARPKNNEKNTGFLPMERAWIDKVIEADFVDTWRETYPETVDRYSYWDVKTRSRERNVGWRIDYFFIDRSLLPSLRNANIHEELYGSDHCPVSIDINV
jgi:exodeoxyribonuclease-3